MPPPAFNLVREAIELDDKKQNFPALIKYTEALVSLGGALMETYKSGDVEIIFTPDSSAKKFLTVVNQCVDRINGLFSNMEKPAFIDRITGKSKVNEEEKTGDLGVEAADLFARCSLIDDQLQIENSTSQDPVTMAIEQNRRLLSVHREKMKKANLTPSAEATANMTLQRQMTENLEMARKRKRETELKKEKTRQEALESLEKNRDTSSLSFDEKQFIADVKAFEAECPDLRLYSYELNGYEKSQTSSPQFRIIFEHYMDTILSIPDHPFCLRMLQTRHVRLAFFHDTTPSADNRGIIRTVVDEDVDMLTEYFLHSLLLKKEMKPKRSQVADRVNEAYISGLMPSLVNYYRNMHSGDLKILKNKLHHGQVERFSISRPSPTVIKDAAKTLKSFNDALTPKAMLNILVSTCKAVSCRELEPEPGPENENLNADDLICTLAAIIVESKSSEVIVWAAIMEEFIDSFGDGHSAIGEEGFCLTSLHAAVQYVMTEA